MAMARSSLRSVLPGWPFLPGLSACGRLSFEDAGCPDDNVRLKLVSTACLQAKQNTATEREQASRRVSTRHKRDRNREAAAYHCAAIEAARQNAWSTLSILRGENRSSLMNLAFSNLDRAQPDLDAADRYARAALAQVPNWHYVRDILIPQIQAAKKNKAGSARKP